MRVRVGVEDVGFCGGLERFGGAGDARFETVGVGVGVGG